MKISNIFDYFTKTDIFECFTKDSDIYEIFAYFLLYFLSIFVCIDFLVIEFKFDELCPMNCKIEYGNMEICEFVKLICGENICRYDL